MHKGRYCPRVQPTYLSLDVVVPYFAPLQLALHGSFEWGSSGAFFWSADNWASAVVDLAGLKITWSSSQTFSFGNCTWIWEQNRAGPGELELQILVAIAGPGSTFRCRANLVVDGFGYRVPFADLIYTELERTGSFGRDPTIGCYSKQWR